MAVAPFSLTDEDLTKDEPLKLLSPANPTPEETIFLSNIDLAVAFTVETVYFFEDGPAAEMSKMVKRAMAVLLVPYYFLAGRLQVNRETGRLELVCNNAGVVFVNAKSKVMMKELGDLSLPNPSFCQFVHRPGLHRSLPERALFTIQVYDEKWLHQFVRSSNNLDVKSSLLLLGYKVRMRRLCDWNGDEPRRFGRQIRRRYVPKPSLNLPRPRPQNPNHFQQ